ncbi:MAG TPA: CocE/NonD family hydrolase [Blastocatellia bacterium]|nr:CocE/NonD family hydrolase [Blastocatellia bacterium]
MKTTFLKKRRSLPCVMVLLAMAGGAWNLTHSSAQSTVETIRWIFAGNDVGSNTYRTLPNGRFESTSEEKVANITINSKLTGKITDGLLTEYELVNNHGGSEVKVTAKEGRVQITRQGNTYNDDFKPAKVLFANEHPLLTETIIRAIDPNKEGPQKIDLLLLDQATLAKVDVQKKGTLTIERGGAKTIIHHYLAYFPGTPMNLYVTQDGRFVSTEVPTQNWRATKTGYEDLIGDPTSRYPELSQPTMKTTFSKGVKIKMRDGAELVADIFRPADGEKYPAILKRTPYGRESPAAAEGEWWASRGYALIVQDVRGRNDSNGEWEPWAHERKDGYDTIAWIAKQSWSNGKVGMIGGSYGGSVQWAAAAEAPPALKCIVPQVSPPDPFFNIPIDHGVPDLLGALFWSNYVRDKRVPAVEWPGDPEKLLTLPLSKLDDAVLGHDIPFFNDWWTKETPSAFGGGFMNDLSKIKIPVLHISGWWDGDGIGTKLNWAKLREAKHQYQWLIYGPWSHDFNSRSRYEDVDYGPDAIMDLDSLYLRWFDTWLKDKKVNWEKQPRVRVFVTGANQWRELSDWPDPKSEPLTFYLSSTGPANGAASGGKLLLAPPKSEKPDQYVYDPAKVKLPEETDSTIVKIPGDKKDLLVYKTEPLNEALDIAGPIELELYFSTDVKDTDFFASLVDVDEKGEMRSIGLPGKIRARYLSGWDTPSLLQPGKTYKAVIALWDLAHRLEKGRRLGIVIKSEMFPYYARNLNTGEPNAEATRMVTATQTIYHDAKRPSALRLRRLK